ncbi:MAG: hypothetical protein QXU49_04640 [Candidatus Caldarchaeum sp.]
MSGLFRFHNYSPFEKVYAALLFVAGLSLRDVSERYCLTSASRESVRCWVHRLGQLFTPERRCRRLVAVDETVEKASGHVDRGPWYPWALKRLGIEYLHETFGEGLQQQKDGQEYRGDSHSHSPNTQHTHRNQDGRRSITVKFCWYASHA